MVKARGRRRCRRDRRADLDVVGRVVVDDRVRGLDHRLEGLDPAFDERLLVLGVLVLGVLGHIAVLFRIVDPLGDLGPADRTISSCSARSFSRPSFEI